MSLAVAPYRLTYTAATPYLTVAEYLNAPTAVDASELIPGGSQAANTQALIDTIARASSWADSLCYQVLAATVDTDPTRRYRVNRYGTIRVPLRYWPVLEVDAASIGATPATMGALTDGSNIAFLGMDIIELPVIGYAVSGNNISPFGYGGLCVGDRPLVSVTYVNGYPNTTITAAATAGATSIVPASVLGIYPGSTLTLYDGAATETVMVAASYVAGAATVPLTTGLLFTHAAGVGLSALPPAVKQAAISLTSCLIKSRGSEAVVMASLGSEPEHTALSEAGGIEDFEVAADLLHPFKRSR